MLMKICKCGKKIPITLKRCTSCQTEYEKRQKEIKRKSDKKYDRTKRKNIDIYHSTDWINLTNLCKQRCNGLDLFAYFEYGTIVKGTLSHHIIPVEDCKSQAYSLDNLIYLSAKSHALIHKFYDKSQKEKEKMQMKLINYLFSYVNRG